MNTSEIIHLLVQVRELANKDCCKNLLTMIINMIMKETQMPPLMTKESKNG